MNTKSEAIECLVKLGVLIPFDENLSLYHGRAKEFSESGEWRVKSDFDNSGNKTGNGNVQAIPVLYVGDKIVANGFAEKRSNRACYSTPEIHRIYSTDKDAMIFNSQIEIDTMPVEKRKLIYEAFNFIVGNNPTALAPVQFEHRDCARRVIDALRSAREESDSLYLDATTIGYVTSLLYSEFPNERDFGGLVQKVARSMNTQELIKNNPRAVIRSYMTNRSEVKDDEGVWYPLNREFMTGWLRQNHIVGEKLFVHSGTLHEDIMIYSIFDLEKINTKDAIEDRKRDIDSRYGRLGRTFENMSFDKKVNNRFSSNNPADIINAVYMNPKFKKFITADAGVWEGFSIGEHTETCLRVFEKSFADCVPENLAPFIRLAILSHDLGKGVAKENGVDPKDLTQRVCDNVYSELGIDSRIAGILQFVIGESQEYTTDLYVKKNAYANIRLNQRCGEILEQAYSRQPPEDVIAGLAGVCKILQTCDSAAYSRYAVTRDRNRKVAYFNGNDRFTKGFKEPTGIAKDRLRFDIVDDIDSPLM